MTQHLGLSAPEEHRSALMEFGETVGSLFYARGWGGGDWDQFVVAVKKARDAGVPWEFLKTPTYQTRGSTYTHPGSAPDPLRLTAVVWNGQDDRDVAQWPLAFAMLYSAKAARALLKMGEPVSHLAINQGSNRAVNIIESPLDAVTWALGFAGERAPKLSLTHRVSAKVGTTVIASIFAAAAKEDPANAAAMAKLALDWARQKKGGLWLNRAGCTPGEAVAAKEVLWAQQVASSIASLESIDPEWAADASKVEEKAKAAGGGKAAIAAREAESVSPEERGRWEMMHNAILRRDTRAWDALAALAGLDSGKGLNSPLANGSHRNGRGHFWLSQAVSLGAYKIAEGMLKNGANPWLLGPDVLPATDSQRKSPLKGVAFCAQNAPGGQSPGSTQDDDLAALGRALGDALLRDAQLVEPSEEAARALVKKELEERVFDENFPSPLRAGLESWSIKASIGLAHLGGGNEKATPSAEPEVRRVSRRI